MLLWGILIFLLVFLEFKIEGTNRNGNTFKLEFEGLYYKIKKRFKK